MECLQYGNLHARNITHSFLLFMVTLWDFYMYKLMNVQGHLKYSMMPNTNYNLHKCKKCAPNLPPVYTWKEFVLTETDTFGKIFTSRIIFLLSYSNSNV